MKIKAIACGDVERRTMNSIFTGAQAGMYSAIGYEYTIIFTNKLKTDIKIRNHEEHEYPQKNRFATYTEPINK